MGVHLTSLEGNRQRLDGGAMFGNAPRPMWEAWLTPDDMGRIELACRCLLVECDGKKLLCGTGIGAFFEPKISDRYGVQTPHRHRLLESLAAVGVKEEDIDFVVLSHLHFDHAGGLLPSYKDQVAGTRQGLLFPKALYVVGEEAWSRSKAPHMRDRASFIPKLTPLLEASGRLLILPKGQTHMGSHFKGRVEFVYSYGHTPGQMHTLIHGEKGAAFFCGDMIPGSEWLHLPMTMGYDRFPELLIDEKRTVYDRAIPERWLLFFTHDHRWSASYCKKNEKDKIVLDGPLDILKKWSL